MSMATDSPFTSPLSYLENPSPSPPRLEIATKVAGPPPPAIVGWSVRADSTQPSTEARSEEGGSTFVEAIVRRDRAAAIVRRAAIVARVSAAILCLISFSVMAADKDKGWALDSFDHYNEYRYCVTVNVFGFVYAAFQAVAEVHHMVNKKHIITKPMGFYFDFAMDQIMAYLLISASSSATSRTDYWVTNWGTDPFPSMISGSVAVSFLAFVAFAISSLISAYNLFSSRTL